MRSNSNTPRQPTRKQFLTVSEVAQELGISERSVWRLIEQGVLPVYNFGGSTRIKRADLDTYIAQSKRPEEGDDDAHPEPE